MEPTRRQIEEALRSMRVPRDGYEAMRESAVRGFVKIAPAVRARTVWRRFSLTVSGREIRLDGEVLCASDSLARLFADCHACAALAVTLGPEVDRLIQLVSRAGMAEAVACDACASVWADSLCDGVEREIEGKLARGEFLTLRFSPGYGDVPMSVTADLLRLLDAGRLIGLTLSRKGMMIPVKSVTALIGIAGRPQPRRRSCADCVMKDCQYRKDGGVCHEEDQ